MPNLLEDAQKDPKGASYGAFLNPLILTKPNVMNSRPWRGAEIGGGNAHSTARSLAKMYGALARGGELDGHRIMRPESLERCWAEQSFGLDQVTQMTTRFSLGFMLPQPGMGYGPNMKAFGHPGAGGSLGFADPVQKVGFGY
jgi:CubicO group peptidase (beta-lactamase class C family)